VERGQKRASQVLRRRWTVRVSGRASALTSASRPQASHVAVTARTPFARMLARVMGGPVCCAWLARASRLSDGLCGQVFGPRSPDPVPKECHIGDNEGNLARRTESTKMDVVLYIMCWVFFAVWCALQANSKGRSPFGWFALGFLFGPFALLFAFYAEKREPNAPVAPDGFEEFQQRPDIVGWPLVKQQRLFANWLATGRS